MLVCTLGAQGAARAQDIRSLSQLYHTAWTTRDGAPADVGALAQTADGYLWLGGTAGLFRFDGVRFTSYQPTGATAAPPVNVSRLLASRDGALWVGYFVGGVSRIERDSVRVYSDKDGVPRGTVYALAQDSSGAVWVGTANGLATFKDGRWHAIGPEQGFLAAKVSGPGEVTSIMVARDGRLWVSAGAGIFTRAAGATRFELVERTQRPSSGGWEGFVADAPDGSIWASDERGLRILNRIGGDHASLATLPPHAETHQLMFDRSGAAWVAFNEGMQRVVPGARPMSYERERLTQERGLSGTRVNVFLEDREGNIWAGTGGGIDRFRRPKLVRAELPPGTIGPFALAAGDSGTIVVGPTSHPPMRLGRGIESFPTVQPHVDAAYRDANGVVWLGGDRGLWRSTGRGFARVTLPNLHYITVQAMAPDSSGHLWVSLTRIDPAVFRRVDTTWLPKGGQPGLPHGMAMVITTDDVGRTWFGYAWDSVGVWSNGKSRSFGAEDGLQLGGVFAIHARRGHVWIGGERGLALFEGNRFRTVASKDGPGFRMITGIVELANGDVWVQGAAGIARVPAAEIRRAANDTSYRVNAEWLDYRDGLDGAPGVGPLPSMIQTSDGRLWFGTNLDLASLDPNRIPRNPLPPPVVIERLTVGDRSFPIANALTLPVRTRSLRIEFTALSLSIPERVRLRYKLTGSDGDWQESGGRRDATYTNLGPGSYEFRVIAANEDGVWNETGATLRFTIPPSFTQSRWFAAIWLLALAALTWLAYRIRMQRVAAGLRARYEAALSERTRIAQELHDTLLQGFTGITIQLRAIQRIIDRQPEAGVVALEKALSAADTTLRDARNSIWDMRAVELEGRDLPEALEGAVRSALSGSPVALDFTVRGMRRPLTPQLETVGLRVGREAVANALKHANATTIAVSLDYGSQALTLEIRDDGDGIAPGAAEAAAANGHLGIAGMKSRAHGTGGTFDVESEAGRGTTVRMVMPVN
jgi:signal transduction histidine kinase/ligand-binding sensor domain-containing protein